jgi:hypothetical protein
MSEDKVQTPHPGLQPLVDKAKITSKPSLQDPTNPECIEILGQLGRFFASLEEASLPLARTTAELADFFRSVFISGQERLSKKCIGVCASILGKLGDKSTLLFDKMLSGVSGG